MKYGIYKGSLVEVMDAAGEKIHFRDDNETSYAPWHEVVEITEESFKAVENEFLAVKSEIRNIKARMYKLDEEYHKKTEALRVMLTEAREKEISIVSKLWKTAKKLETEMQE